MIFQKKFSPGFHIFFKQGPTESAKRSAGTGDAESGLVFRAAVFMYTCHGSCVPEHTLCQICHQSFRRRALLIPSDII